MISSVLSRASWSAIVKQNYAVFRQKSSTIAGFTIEATFLGDVKWIVLAD